MGMLDLIQQTYCIPTIPDGAFLALSKEHFICPRMFFGLGFLRNTSFFNTMWPLFRRVRCELTPCRSLLVDLFNFAIWIIGEQSETQVSCVSLSPMVSFLKSLSLSLVCPTCCLSFLSSIVGREPSWNSLSFSLSARLSFLAPSLRL